MLRRLLHSLLVVFGVTLVSFVLMVYYGPDQTYTLLGKSATTQQITEVRHELGYDRAFSARYLDYMVDLFSGRLGASQSSGEPVTELLARTVPISLMLVIPGFVLGNLLGIWFGLLSVRHLGRWPDRLISGLSVAGMSLSFLIIIIGAQVLFSTPFGLNLFPVRGWQVDSLTSYLYYVTVPTLCMITITLGYNTRFYRSVFAEEYARGHITTLRAFGATPWEILLRHVLKNSLTPMITRLMFTIPLVVVSGSLLIESYFGIPGIGRATFDAIGSTAAGGRR